MPHLFRTLLLIAAIAALALPAHAVVTIPRVAKNYDIVVRGECFSLTPKVGGGETVTFLRRYVKNGRMRVTPRVVTTTTNGNNIRDVVFIIDHGLTGGVGAMQFATNASLYSFIAPGLYTPIDFAFVSANAAVTKLTIKVDPARLSGSNFFKVEAGFLPVPELYTDTQGTIIIAFLANGRISGSFSFKGTGQVNGTRAAITGTFSGVASTGSTTP